MLELRSRKFRLTNPHRAQSRPGEEREVGFDRAVLVMGMPTFFSGNHGICKKRIDKRGHHLRRKLKGQGVALLGQLIY